jgi:signal transduction histidine kinase
MIKEFRMNGARRFGPLAAAHRRVKQEISRRKVLERALRKTNQRNSLLLKEALQRQQHLRHLSRRVLSAQEEERKLISRELHDEIGQILTGVTVRLAGLKREAAAGTKGLEKRLAGTQRLLEKTMRIVHRSARDLRPPILDDLGLIPALRSFMRQFTQRTRIPIRFTAFAAVERLNSDKRTVLYRVGQESLTNVAKHAQATRVTVDIRRVGDDVRLEIDDDGKSFRVQRVLSAGKVVRLGLLGMRERVEMVGGVFSVVSTPGKGTTVRAQIPMNK